MSSQKIEMDKLKNIKDDSSGFPKDYPFDVPEWYFETLDDRIEARIHADSEGNASKVVHLIKPVLGLVASFILVYLLVSYPMRKFMPQQMDDQISEQVEPMETYRPDVEKDILANSSFFDENSFFQALTDEENLDEFVSEEIFTIVASEIDDYAIYADIIY